ncbi:30S ribosomal protein S1 [Buchnera aphidicola (Thelaxes californica)]|uniref:30S ribosomal protein S1 n=1 Tax=Buchnera aphidicola (Thelaxes californica) TaxID=1315998 RepID=A0A4D6YLB0_9GAMM|nr:30S ribosomal protein S1 [Buchnera aphidicola]QCI26770.1 30S ribosomal protein S1 [Buchnera aphidicola (Thelaxes californica)]
MIESFSNLFKESLKTINTKPGSIIQGTIISIEKDTVLVDAGLKSESNIPIEQFKDAQGKLEIQIGDIVDVALDAVEDGFGSTLLSREKAKRHESWIILEKAYKDAINIKGLINGKVKGGFTVELNDIRAFLPGSLVDVRPIRDSVNLEGQELEFKVIKLDKKRNNVVVSRRAVIEYENSAERDQLLQNLKEGINLTGIVKNLTDYGAFVDLGGVDGLLHITDMAWKRVKHPSEIVNIGDEIQVKILKFDKERTRVSLGLKQLGEDPWVAISTKYPEGIKIDGRVTNLTDYGCFVEIQEGVEGLVHVSEMDWTNKNIHPSKLVNINETVKVMVLDIDEDRRRISLGLKQCKNNPWKEFLEENKKGSHVQGKIKSITDFGIFVGLPKGIDGLIHLSDISWTETGEKLIDNYKKGEDITAVVLQVDAERERISLGLKHLKEDPLNKFFILHKKKNKIIGTIVLISEKNNQIILSLENGVRGIITLNTEILLKHYENKKKLSINDFKIGQKIEVMIHNIDKKNRIINVIYVPQNNDKKKIQTKKLKTEINIAESKKNGNNIMTEAFKAAQVTE